MDNTGKKIMDIHNTDKISNKYRKNILWILLTQIKYIMDIDYMDTTDKKFLDMDNTDRIYFGYR